MSFEGEHRPDIDFTAPAENQEANEPAVEDRQEEEQDTRPTGRMRRFANSTFGRILRMGSLTGALTFGALERGLPVIERLKQPEADDRRWAQLHERDSVVEKPAVTTLREATPEQREKILKVRDREFTLALDEAVSVLAEQLGGTEGARAKAQEARQLFSKYQPSETDKALDALGIPVRVDRSYPALRIVPNSYGPTSKQLHKKLDRRSAHGMYQTTSTISQTEADTIFVSMKDPETSLDTMLHEENHWRLQSFKGDSRYANIIGEFSGTERAFEEGVTEYMTKLVQKKQGRELKIHQNYDRFVWAANLTERALGRKRFWQLVEHDWSHAVGQELDQKFGFGTMNDVFGDHGARERLFGDNPVESFRAYRSFHDKGLLQRDDVTRSQEELSLDIPTFDRAVMETSEHRPIGYVMPSENGIDVYLETKDERGHFGVDQADSDPSMRPLEELAGVPELWQEVRHKFFSDELTDQQKYDQFPAFRDSVARAIETMQQQRKAGRL